MDQNELDDVQGQNTRLEPHLVDAEDKIKTEENTDIEEMTDAVDELSQTIDTNLRAFRGQFSRLSDAILEHTEKVRRGEFEGAEIGSIFKRIDPVLNLSIQQETKLNDQLAARVGRAGKYAISFDEARSEIGRRLTRLRASVRAADLSGGNA